MTQAVVQRLVIATSSKKKLRSRTLPKCVVRAGFCHNANERQRKNQSVRLPAAVRTGWHDPEVDLSTVHIEHAVGNPVSHVERMRDHARPRLQLAEQLRAELQVYGGQK